MKKILVAAFALIFCGCPLAEQHADKSLNVVDRNSEVQQVSMQIALLRLEKPEIVLSIKDEYPVQWGGERFVSRAGLKEVLVVEALNEVLQSYGKAIGTLRKASSIPTEKLDAIRAQAEAKSGRKLPDMANDFVLDFKAHVTPDDIAELITKLRQSAAMSQLSLRDGTAIKAASANAGVFPENLVKKSITKATQEDIVKAGQLDLSSLQFYFKDSPVGTGTASIWAMPGGKGEGVTITTIGPGIDKNHEDMPPVTVYGESCFFNTEPIFADNGDHDLAAMSIVAAPHNGYGINGAVPNAKFQYKLFANSAEVNADSVVELSQDRPFGIDCGGNGFTKSDVIFFEVGTRNNYLVPLDGRIEIERFLPIDVGPTLFKAISIATANETHVLIAAANGYINGVTPPNGYKRPFGVNLNELAGLYPDPYYDHHGIRVGASAIIELPGSPTNISQCSDKQKFYEYKAHALLPENFSNYGSGVGNYEVHLFAAGGSVVAATNSASDREPCFDNGPASNISRWYQSFSGTSSATPIVAGAVAQIIGVLRAKGRTISPLSMRNILQATGSPQAGSFERNIGVMPNVVAALNAISSAAAPVARTNAIPVANWPPLGSHISFVGIPAALPVIGGIDRGGVPQAGANCAEEDSRRNDSVVWGACYAVPSRRVASGERNIRFSDARGWGEATFSCENGLWSAPLDATCSPGGSCASSTQSWPTSNPQCSGIVGAANNGQKSIAFATSPNDGRAEFQCENGAWKLQGGWSCNVPPGCAAEEVSWLGTNSTCRATLGKGAEGDILDVTDADGDEIGEASYRCLGSQWKRLSNKCSYSPRGATYFTQYLEPYKPTNWGNTPAGYVPVTLNAQGTTSVMITLPAASKKVVRLLINGDTNGTIDYGDCGSRAITVWQHDRDSYPGFVASSPVSNVPNSPLGIDAKCRVRHVVGDVAGSLILPSIWQESANGRVTSYGTKKYKVDRIGPFTWEWNRETKSCKYEGCTYAGEFLKPVAMPAVLDFEVFDLGARKQNVSVQWRGYRIEVVILWDSSKRTEKLTYPLVEEWTRHNVDAFVSHWDEFTYQLGSDTPPPRGGIPYGRSYVEDWKKSGFSFSTMSRHPTTDVVDYTRQLLQCGHDWSFKQTADNCVSLGYVLQRFNSPSNVPYFERVLGVQKASFQMIKLEPSGHTLARPKAKVSDQANVVDPFGLNNTSLDSGPHWYLVFKPYRYTPDLVVPRNCYDAACFVQEQLKTIMPILFDDDDD
ncbi:MAG: S8 family serine peptidase [Casimicrobium sp.]